MSTINAKDVMALRNKTGLAMMECKKALTEADGDPERAEELLRKKLKGKMESRSDRAAGEGRVAVVIQGDKAAIVELRAETDFTAKNDKFIAATDSIANMALTGGVGSVTATDSMAAIIDDLRITTGENISFARGEVLSGGHFGQYVHFDGKTGVLLQTAGPINEETAKQVCMHITAAVPPPVGITESDIPAEVVEKERRFRIEQAMESGKPQEIAEKMVEGGMRKFFAEIALVEQPFVMDPSKTVKDVLGDVSVTAFRRWRVGQE
jgi:elongation factor Ts